MSMQMNKQSGGTLVGFIAGLVVGLAIAVVVAITINKTPMPFTDKSGRPDKPAEASAAAAGDPNAPMYGSKDAARQAARDLAAERAQHLSDTQNNVPAAAPEASAAVDANGTDAKSADARGADGAATDAKWTYYLQAGAFRNQSDAESAKARLALQGVEASVQERPSDAGTLYRVRIGPFDQLEAMNRVRSKLSEGGMDVAVIRVAK